MIHHSKTASQPARIQVRLADRSDQTVWDAYVLGYPEGLAYQLYAWKEAVEGAYGFDCPYFAAVENNQVRGVLPTAVIHLPFSRGTLVSLPYCDAGGPLADSADIQALLLKQAIAYARDRKIACLEIRSAGAFGQIDKDRTRNRQKVRMLLPIDGDGPALLAGFKAKLRSQIKKPRRDGLRAVVGGIEMVAEFYSVFVENMRDLGSPVHSRKWFDWLFAAYGKRARCALVYMPDGQPAAGGVILCHPQTVSIPWASSLRRLNRWNPNMLLYWTLLEYAANQGCRFFDFGRSTPGEGTYRFKKQWGARENHLHWARFSALKELNGQTSFEPMAISGSQGRVRDAAEKVIQQMPIGLSQWLGSRLRRYISL